MSLSNEANQRGLKDFLTLYNTITEYCFNKCVSNFNERDTSSTENSCLNVCTDNYVQFNQRFMFNFVDHQERRKRDLELAAAEMAKKAAAEIEVQKANADLENLDTLVQTEKPVVEVETSPDTDQVDSQQMTEQSS